MLNAPLGINGLIRDQLSPWWTAKRFDEKNFSHKNDALQTSNRNIRILANYPKDISTVTTCYQQNNVFDNTLFWQDLLEWVVFGCKFLPVPTRLDHDQKNYNDQLSQRLASLGIMDALWNPTEQHSTTVSRSLKGGPQLETHYAERP